MDLSFLACYMLEDVRSITGKNMHNIASHYDIDISDIKSDTKYMFTQKTDGVR